MTQPAQCPFHKGASKTTVALTEKNSQWWPGRLDLKILNKNAPQISPTGSSFDYAAAFGQLDLAAVKADIVALMHDSQDWWPADFGHYGGLFIRMAWHSAGTYRISDGRGGAGSGQQRFAPLNSWPDNVNLDKARRLLWPIKAKYGQSLSWADLIVLAGTVALEDMGLPVVGFAGGREDAWEAEDDVYWGAEAEWLDDKARYSGERDLEDPLAAVQMGLIYVNPEGPGGNGDPVASARDIRETFARMAMNDYETVALIAGGHTFGKTHGAVAADNLGPEPEAAPLEAQGLGWINHAGASSGAHATTSGLEVTWSQTPTQWSNHYFENLFGYDWEMTTSPAGAHQWRPVGGAGAGTVPDAHDPAKAHAPGMLTSDLALRFDPAYEKISRHFLANPDELATAFAEAWYKLTHRDMGPPARFLGPDVPAQPRIWQDPVPAVDHPLIDEAEARTLKEQILASGLSVSRLVKTAWASAATYRHSDKRGGTNGARLALAPQKDWAVNEPDELAKALEVLKGIKAGFDAKGAKKVSLADLIVLAGNAGVEAAAKAAGYDIAVPFTAGRTDATVDQTDADSFAVLEPRVDGFRNYIGVKTTRTPEELLVDKANLLTLSVPEMSVLVAGLRVLGANVGDSKAGMFTHRVGTLSNDFFVNLLATGTTGVWQGKDGHYSTSDDQWEGSRVDLLFGSNAQLRAIAEHYGAADGEKPFVTAFAAAWAKVMDLGRF
ncbi:catalase/peroxidase HPI [Novosphingobium umbonatum]|uniref:Catalase-peroxidase n=1 Tax=Novosphingobium umbonatum TaxID=1908524 RepID=A0A3S2Y8C0_9SPHN|nr:catalase/peroxidase HPI [Novosphingobium umbonatum]RVU05835.1 catalase/peroxidase HPI [Novosphingobium umbonatum]